MNIILYYHTGSLNHGCEAIIRATNTILKKYVSQIILYSFNAKEDNNYKFDSNLSIKQTIHFVSHEKNKYIRKKIQKNFYKKFMPDFLLRYKRNKKYKEIFKDIINLQENIFMSIGGDNYCYEELDALSFINKALNEKNKKTILFGCSIEPQDIENNRILKEDLNRYSLITARESLTYNALIKNGINKNTHLFPDPAFLLDKEMPTDLPNNFISGNTIGLNLSPMVQRLEKGNNIAYKNFFELIKYIISNTDMNIALIPHVVWENNNDLDPLTELYKQFKNTNRVSLIDKPYNACQLKGIISQCRFMIAARTHASIAAYSTQVPTLVIGYSVKAKGIAKDIFGDYKDYVLPVQELKDKTEVLEAFKKLMQNEDKIREHYKNFMPAYIERTWLAGKEVGKLLNN